MFGHSLDRKSRGFAWALVALFAMLQGACNVGSSDPEQPTLFVATSLGYPILGSTVTLKGSNGASIGVTSDSKTGIASLLAWQVATLGNPPYLIKSSGGTANGIAPPNDYYSIATASSGRFNVTPVTHLLAVQATGSASLAGMASLFSSGYDSTKAAALTTTKLATSLNSVNQALKATNPLIDLGTIDPLTVVFAEGDAFDDLLDQVQLTLKNAGTSNSALANALDTIQGYVTKVAAGATPDTSALTPFKRLIVFGDSLSDGGAYTRWAAYAATGNAALVGSGSLADLAKAAPFGGKFTTNPGSVWVENLATALGYALKPANLMGGGIPSVDLTVAGGCTTCTNYAQGGSRVTMQPGIGNVGTSANPANVPVAAAGFTGNSAGAAVAANPVLIGAAKADYSVANRFLGASTLPVVQQINQHMQSAYVTTPGLTTGKFAATDLVIVLAGANDIFTQAGLAGAGAITSTAAGTEVAKAAAELAAQVARIKSAGAKHVLVVGLPDMGVTPYGVASGAAAAGALTSLSQGVFNPALKAGLAAVPGVAYLDPVPVFTKIVASPSAFGFTKVIDSTSPVAALASAACGPNAIAQTSVADSATSPSSLFCSAANTAISATLGTLRALLANDTYVFADGVHPTTKMHSVLAQYVREKMALLLASAIVPAS